MHPYLGRSFFYGVETVVQFISMKITELMTTIFNFSRELLTFMLGSKEGRASGMWAIRRAWLSYPGLSQKSLVNFYFIIVIVSFEIFHSEPDRPDWQIQCLIFLVLDYMLFLKAIFIY